MFKIYVLVFACALCYYLRQKSQICSKVATYLFSAYFGGHFVTIATVKINLIPYPYTWAIVLLVKSNFIFWFFRRTFSLDKVKDLYYSYIYKKKK